MFRTALFTVVKIWKQAKCLSIREQKNKQINSIFTLGNINHSIH